MIMVFLEHRLSYPTGSQCLLKGAKFGKKPIRAPSKIEFSNSYHYCIDSDLAISGVFKCRVNGKLPEV